MNKISEALDILRQFNVPKKQQNERSALTLLALISLKENDSWSDSKKTFIRIHDLMRFIKNNYNKEYAENSRETFRRQTLHQFEKEVGIVERNSDDPKRPTNSPNTMWSISNNTLEIIKTYGTDEWNNKLIIFLENIEQTIELYKEINNKHKLSIYIKDTKITFSPGKHNELQINILNNFKKHFCKISEVIYVGDTAHKMLYINKNLIKKFKITKHDILPDIILLDLINNNLYLIEAVTSHGPVSTKRFIELNEYFKELNYNKIFISAFPDFKEFKRHIEDIAWETYVWVAKNPNNIIHFNKNQSLK